MLSHSKYTTKGLTREKLVLPIETLHVTLKSKTVLVAPVENPKMIKLEKKESLNSIILARSRNMCRA